jgi:hypothetical protein
MTNREIREAERKAKEQQRLDRQDKRDARKEEAFREGKFRPSSSAQRERLERRFTPPVPPPDLQKPPIPAINVKVGEANGGIPIKFYAWKEGKIGTFDLLASSSFKEI